MIKGDVGLWGDPYVERQYETDIFRRNQWINLNAILFDAYLVPESRTPRPVSRMVKREFFRVQKWENVAQAVQVSAAMSS